jgi:hypothetical protein
VNNIQANTTATFSGFGILSGTQASTVQNGSSMWTAAFPNFLQVLLGSVQPEAKPADADAYGRESTNDVEGVESFRRTSSTQSKDAAETITNDSNSPAGTFMHSMLAVNLVLAPVPQFVPVTTTSTVAVTSGWNAVSGTSSVSSSAVESSTSAPEVQQATATVPVRNEEMSAPKANVIPAETRPSESQSTASETPTVNARPIRAGQTPVGNIAFELNLEAKQSVASAKPLFTNNALFAKQQFTDFKKDVHEAYSAVEPAANTATFTISTLPEPTAVKPQAAKEAATVSHPQAVELHETQPPRPHTRAVQEIGLRIGPENTPVDVTLRTRGGEVQVAVRTNNTALESSLREELGTLVKALERSGFDAKSFTPALTSFDGLRAGDENGRGNRNSSKEQRPKQNSRRGTFEFLEVAA